MKKARFIYYSKMYPKEYLKFCKAVKSEPYTRNQMKFAMYLLGKKKEISIMGNLEQVFHDVRNYFRYNK